MNRNTTDPFKELQRIENDIAKFEEQSKQLKRNEADWANPHARVEYVRELKRARRRALLDYLVPDRRCISCGEIYLLSRSWVISKDKSSARCRSCTMKGKKCR